MKGKDNRDRKSPKESLRILNTREKKEINQSIEAQWGCELDKSYVFLLSNKNRLYISDKDIGMIDFSVLRVDSMGAYIATVDEKGVRLSIEGSQLLGPLAKKNVVEVDDESVRAWFKGEDLPHTGVEAKGAFGFVILKNGEDFIGCGRVTERGILNFVPKARRIAGE
jgi:NOL1/NOP2/fmu family ribosome biogenesis protein